MEKYKAYRLAAADQDVHGSLDVLGAYEYYDYGSHIMFFITVNVCISCFVHLCLRLICGTFL